jgi:ketosteroid isomerase-like protein
VPSAAGCLAVTEGDPAVLTDQQAAERAQFIDDYYAACDVPDWDAMSTFLHPQVEFRNGNSAPMHSFAELKERVAGAMREVTVTHTVTSIMHDIGGQRSAVELAVRLERPDGRKFEGPACGMFWFDDDGLIVRYHAYIDEGGFWE